MRVVLVVTVLLLAGCITEESSPEYKPDAATPQKPAPEPPVESHSPKGFEPTPATETTAATVPVLGQDERWEFSLDGSGWGLFQFLTNGSFAVSIDVDHRTYQNLDVFGDANGEYADGGHSFVSLYSRGQTPLDADAFYWVWWGSPGQDWWPSGNNQPYDSGSLSSDGSGLMTLLVSNDVPGYTVKIGGGSVVTKSNWTLTPHPDAMYAHSGPLAPTQPVSVDVVSWEEEVESSPAAILFYGAWDSSGGVHVKAGAEATDYGYLASQRGSPGAPLPTYSWGTGGGSGWGKGWGQTDLPADTNLLLFLDVDMKGVNQNGGTYGADFLMIPTAPPSEP